MRQRVRQIAVSPVLTEYIAALAQASRSFPGVELGVSPRGSLALYRASQAYALVRGGEFVTPEDVKAVAVPVLAHRLSVSGGAGSAKAQEQAAEALLSSVPVPTEDWNR